MIRKTHRLSLLLGLFWFGIVHAAPIDTAAKAYEDGDYERALSYLSAVDKANGPTPRAESLRALSFNALGRTRESYISALRYEKLTKGRNLAGNEAHQAILDLRKDIRQRLAEELKKEQEAKEQERMKEGESILRTVTEGLEKQRAAVIRRSKQEAERSRLAKLEPFRDCADCPEMVNIPNKAYALGKYHVTRGEFAKFVSETNYDAGNSCTVWRYSSGLFSEGWKLENQGGTNWRNPGFSQDDSHPVVCVSWHDAQAYVQWLSKKTGKQYRLPNDKEWEYACYGGSQTEYCGGSDINAVAWYSDNSGNQTHPAGQKQPNGYGLYDMSGNVWQWMENEYGDGQRALRGGSWIHEP
jgi:formylglycine-generating enzyme required for sulfatase activity